jgi:uncharacterized protein (TIGR02452 family)
LSQLSIHPAIDSIQRGEAAKTRLQLNHKFAIWLGLTAAESAKTGLVTNAAGETIDISAAIERAVEQKESIAPHEPLELPSAPRFRETRVKVVNDTTLSVAKQLTTSDERTAVLNFANGVEPGGGFLNGSLAQEETLCRSSALHATLEGDPMYEAHRKLEIPMASSNWIIRSPSVPVFRKDDGSPEDAPWNLTFLTCAAPFAPHVGQPRSHELLDTRIQRVLEVAASRGHTSLILGAWGCGAFQNDPEVVAGLFRKHLENFAGHFREIVFAVTDWSEERRRFGPFARALAISD